MGMKIALTGNPNVGKTSLYNRLTRSFEHVGNWHGVTVKKVGKSIAFGGDTVEIDDLPGLYSLTACSFEEGIARDSILSDNYDVIINICEINNLPRNLYLTLQLLELNLPVVLVVNMIDELTKRGKSLNIDKLEKELGVPVLPLSAKYKIDSSHLLSVCEKHANSFTKNRIKLDYLDKLPLNRVILATKSNITEQKMNSTYAAIKLLENDSFVLEKLKLSNDQIRMVSASTKTQSDVAMLRYKFIDSITEGVIISNSDESKNAKRQKNTSEQKKSGEIEENKSSIIKGYKKASSSPLYLKNAGRVDRVILNKYLALPIFLLIMIMIFAITFGMLGKWLSDGLELLIEKWIYLPSTSALTKLGADDWLVALVGEGIILGVGGILVFLPQIVLLFFFLALLEDSGYIARVAFMTDGLFRKIGLSGRSAFTMLMGFGCSATAVLTARGLEDENMRKKTVLLTPFMSCSARLPVYSAIGAAFFLSANPIVIFMLYFLGAIVALLLAAVLERIKRFKSGKLSFIMEMPPYRLPTFERVRQLIWNNSKVFIVRVGTVIFGLNVVVWMLANFSVYGYTKGTNYQSFLESFSGLIAPLFHPLGFGNWEAVTALLSGLVAKESVLATIESLGGISAVFAGEYPQLTALCFLVFTLLYVACFATLSAIAKELGVKWALISFLLQMSVAYMVTLIVRLVGLIFIYNTSLAITILLVVIITVAAVVSTKSIVTRKACQHCSSNACSDCNKKEG